MPVSEIPKPANNAVEKQSQPAIDIQKVTKSFGPQRVLDGVSFEVQRGETLAVLGRSGTGKSVLLRIIVGLQTPDSGAALILGTNMAEADAAAIAAARTQMGFLFQHSTIHSPSKRTSPSRWCITGSTCRSPRRRIASATCCMK